MNTNETSEITRKAINILFVANPKGTSIGIFLGVVLDGLVGLFTPLLKSIQWLSISAIKTWHLIGFGVFSMNLPSYLKRKEVDPIFKLRCYLARTISDTLREKESFIQESLFKMFSINFDLMVTNYTKQLTEKLLKVEHTNYQKGILFILVLAQKVQTLNLLENNHFQKYQQNKERILLNKVM